MDTFIQGVFSGFHWFLRIVKLHVIWLVAVLSGFGIFSLFPAVTAAFGVASEWIKGNEDTSIAKLFLKEFRRHFWRSQAIGYLFLAVYAVLYIDIRLFLTFGPSVLLYAMLAILSVLLCMTALVNLHVYPLLLRKGGSVKGIIRTAFFRAMASLHWSLLSLAGTAAILILTVRYPAAAIFLTAGTLVLWIACMDEIIQSRIGKRHWKLNARLAKE